MSKYQAFIFKDYSFDQTKKTLTLTYGYDVDLVFTETYVFDFDFVDYEPAVLDRAIQHLFYMAGVSYYKAYLPPQIQVQKGQIDTLLSEFLSKTYDGGLGEFFYVNHMDPRTKITFPVTVGTTLNMLSVKGAGKLIGLGGGKDSLVSVELLRNHEKVATWSLNHRSQLEPLVSRVGLPHLWVERSLDPQIQTLNKQDAMNGHVPISAILACVGTVVAVLSGYQDIVVSNESSASEPTLTYQGVAINHQYSKSLTFEKDYQQLLKSQFGDTLRYYSLIRPFTELKVAEMFTDLYDKYADVFSSCNRAYVLTSDGMSWCGKCAKCAFVCLVLTPFIDKQKLEQLWGKNLLLDPELEQTYKQLLGIEGDKPLDCVGEVKESRSAMLLAFETYPELSSKYEFDVPTNYDFRAPSENLIPSELHTAVGLT